MAESTPKDLALDRLLQWMADLAPDCHTHDRVYSKDVIELMRLVFDYLQHVQGTKPNDQAPTN